MKKLLASALALSMVAGMSVVSFASATINMYNNDGDVKLDNNGAGLSFENVRPDSTYWIPMDQIIGDMGTLDFSDSTGVEFSLASGAENYLGDKDYFKVSFDKDGDGRSLINSVSIVNDKRITSGAANTDITSRTSWLKIVTNQTFSDAEKKASIEVEIKPKKSVTNANFASSMYNSVLTAPAAGDDVDSSDKAEFKLTFWVTNEIIDGDSADVDTGDAFVFKPAKNEENIIIYGDDRAGLYFDANDDASKFYAKLSTKSHTDIYTKYGDPLDADLWFYDFVGNSTIPATSRATVTLGIPWDTDKDYVPNPEDCFIYRLLEDGTLQEVPDFKYNEDNDDTTGIEGWSMRTRTLGTFVLSDTELMLDEEEEEEEEEESSTSEESSAPVVSTPDKEIPPTGSSDMVNVAVVAAALSLAAAGAVAFKKASK